MNKTKLCSCSTHFLTQSIFSHLRQTSDSSLVVEKGWSVNYNLCLDPVRSYQTVL